MYKIVPSDSLEHSWAGSDKNYTAEEKAKEKKYNHEYYMKNKEKWGVKDDGKEESKSESKDSKETSEAKTETEEKKTEADAEFDVDAAAMDVIRGKYGNGQERKDELGEDYEIVQKRVNELMKEMGLTGKKAEKKEEEKKWDTSKDLKDRGFSSSTDGMKDDKKKSTVKHSYTVVSSDDELYHHGIIGQKWGVRRFQNSNGSLTAAGKQRYGGKSKSTVENPPAVVKTKNPSNLSSKDTIRILNESENILNKSDNASKSINKIKKSEAAKKKEKEKTEENAPKKVEEMSDKELREFLNRYDMEQRYDKIQNEHKKDIMTGQEKVQEILEVTKDVAAIAVSAATIYAILNGKK